MLVSYHPHRQKKRSPGRPVKPFLNLIQTKYYYLLQILQYYSHHNCSVNVNWNYTQLYSSAKPLRNVPSSVFWFVNFCFLPFLCRTCVQKWKKTWLCYVHMWIGAKEMSAYYIYKRSTNQSCVQRSRNPCNFETVHYFVFKFLDSQHKISVVLLLLDLWKNF